MKPILSSIIFTVLVFSIPDKALAERFVVVNGNRLSYVEIIRLEKWHCGPIANGYYWLNFSNGVWGYAGNPIPQGNITDNCYQQRHRPGLSERGLLYSPGELLR